MMKRSSLFFFAVVLVLSGCGILSKQSPVTYNSYTYEQPYDLIFLTTFEVIDTDNDWTFNSTAKELGRIDIQNMNSNNFFGIDRQYARFLIKHVSDTETSVELDPANTNCKDGVCVRLLERVNEVLSALPPRPKKETPPDEEIQEAVPPPAA